MNSQLREVINVLAEVVDAKDKYTIGHSQAVATKAKVVGHCLGLDSQQLDKLEVAAFMHDLGKIGIPDIILAKPDKLSREEFNVVKKHPVLTRKILEPLNSLSNHVILGAIHHHERLNGTGYPFGLANGQISKFGRIIAVVDVFDALTSDRPYRNALSERESLRIVWNGAGELYDFDVVHCLIKSVDNGLI
ncbi:hypothetical protein GF1_16310 [Desulfolithobacter dissulfuricans]|uniref:HD-GYP domain-containing protein n=1 Tax=Desulfolithobacter dissulfuricans TaxID=2795293 RepID=A0A915U1X0_9BACT|nr:HD-GYP domain-containing protein [Desulfolithobacter dissulfuricans]BCO09255.1 hypothetical protein GF1_16310 [Desulfolithobacter dissulfuricans]